MSKAFEEANKLTDIDPLPVDVMAQLDELQKQIDPEEEEDFGWLYEGALMEVSDKGKTN